MAMIDHHDLKAPGLVDNELCILIRPPSPVEVEVEVKVEVKARYEYIDREEFDCGGCVVFG
jgi:hypothetical protein